jgi:glycosyltransferase involved in cell wall biosynthesis
MPRIGMNPARSQNTDYKPARITLAMLTHVPNKIGYFEKRFEVVRVSLESFIAHTPRPYDLMVFDNNSSPQLVDYLKKLRDDNMINFLILSSRNIGKLNAFQIIFRAAPGEIIAYSDDDVFFLPGWLDESLKVLETYPKVGMVTGMYIRLHMKEGISSVLEFAKRPDVKVKTGELIPKELEQHFIDNTGRTWDQYKKETEGFKDIQLTYKGLNTLASAGHYQFVTRKQVILEALPRVWYSQLMGKMRELDLQIDLMGYMRLCTTPPTIRLLGNLINPEMAEEIKKYGFWVEGSELSYGKPNLVTRFYRNSFVRKVAYNLYNRLFRIINA